MSTEKDKILRKNLSKPSISTIEKITSLKVKSVAALSPVLIQTILERKPDNMVLVTLHGGSSLIIHWEYQVKNDSKMVIRNAIYDLLIYAQHKKEVMTIVLYIGNKPMTMKNTITFLGNNYSCKMINVKNLDPEIFLQSPDYKEVIIAVLAGPDDYEQKVIIIKKIITKLHLMLRHSETEFNEKIKELELLAQARGSHIQEIIKKEMKAKELNWVEKLGFTKEKSLIYRRELREMKREVKQETATKLIKEGIDLSVIHRTIGMSMRTLMSMQKKLSARPTAVA